MLDRRYDPALPYAFALYGRMSDPRQNKRSPDQQFNTIAEAIERHGYPWRCVATYRDDGISGRYLRKRPGLQRLLRDIEAKLIRIDLLVVDTLERLGRAEEIAELRRKLLVDYGILTVAADTGFSDPTGVVGKAVGLVEQIRSTENTRVSRHNVIRGKKDAARRGRWPGGPPPFGFRLKRIINETVSPPEVCNLLEPEPRQAAILRRAFERAAATGDGDLRLSQWWNASGEIPDQFKPISPFTMGYRLENPIAIGTLRWGENRTGVVNDTRVIEPNPDGPELIADFCAPVVSVELYERVQQIRRLRGAQIKSSRASAAVDGEQPAKFIAPQGRGLTLKYLLTGLVRCGCCQASMRPVPSGRRSKAGRRYVYYTCPRHYDGACGNGRHVAEDRLRAAVVARIRARLFPLRDQAGLAPPWCADLLGLVRQELQRLQADRPDDAAVAREELRQLEKQLAGWLQTLGNPQLAPVVRSEIETCFARGKERQQALLQSLRPPVHPRANEPVHDLRAVIDSLHRLDGVLAAFNPTVGNLELARHIEAVHCHGDGRVELRGTRFGLFDGAIELLSQGDGPNRANSPNVKGFSAVVPRRRGHLRVPNLSSANAAPAADAPFLATELRDGAGTLLSWAEPGSIGAKQAWSEEHATEVARLRRAGKTHEELAAYFEVSIPTIRKSLRIASQLDGATTVGSRRIPRRRWPDQNFAEVAWLRQQGMSVQQLCQHFQRSEPLIRAALELAQQHALGNATNAGTGSAEP
jgi:DNA invertase Pin-like site-specific DNA recombinase